MPRFTNSRYPHLTLQDDKGVWAQFADGIFETTDAATAKRLRALAASEGITEALPEPDAGPGPAAS